MISQFEKTENGYWQAMNCHDADIQIIQGRDGDYFALVNGMRFNIVERKWNDLVKLLEANFSWIVKLGHVA